MTDDNFSEFKPCTPEVANEVLTSIRQRKELYSERDIVLHNIRRYRVMRQKVNLPRNWAKRLGGDMAPKVPVIYRLIQTAVTAVAKDFPQINEEALSLKDKPAADRHSRALQLLLQTIDRQHNLSFFYNLYFKHFGDGMSVIKTLPGKWTGYPIREDDESASSYNDRVDDFLEDNPNPYYISLVDPLTFYPPMDEYGEGPAVEISWRSTRDTFAGMEVKPSRRSDGSWTLQSLPPGEPYPDRELPPGMPPTTEFSEAWTDEACFISCNLLGSGIWYREHDLGKKPVHSWGFADPTGVDDPANKGMSVAFPLYYLAPHIDSMVGLMMAWSTFMAPTMYTTQQASPYVRPTAETTTTNWEPGMFYHLPTGRDLRVVQAPDMGAPAGNFLSMLLGLGDKGGLPPQISGDIQGSRLPSLTLERAFDAGIARLSPAVKGLEYVIGDMVQKVRRIVADNDEDIPLNGWELVDEDVKVPGWAKLEASQCRKRRPITVRLSIDSQQDEIAKGTHAMYMEGVWSLRRRMKYSGVKDADEEMAELGADKAMKIAQELQARKSIMDDPELGPLMQQMSGGAAGGGSPPGARPGVGPEPPGGPLDTTESGGGGPGNEGGPGLKREGYSPDAGGGRNRTPTQKPRGARASPYGRS